MEDQVAFAEALSCPVPNRRAYRCPYRAMPALKAILSRLRPGAFLVPIPERRASPDRRQGDRRSNVYPLQDKEARLRLAARAMGFGTYELDCESGTNIWSPELRAIAGLPPEDGQMGPEWVEDLLHPEDRERVIQKLWTSLDPAGTGEFEDEHRLLRPDGSVRWVKASGRTFFVGQGEARRPLGATGVIMDITERREAEEALRRSRRNLDLAVRAAAIGIWNWNLVTGEINFSERCRQLFGLSPDEVLSFEGIMATLHPEDREGTRQQIRAALAGHGEYLSAHRVVWPDGSVRWVESIGLGEYNEAGEAVSMNGIVMDITERKTVEEAQRQQAEHLKLALRAGRSGTFEWDARTYRHHWSDELLALYGISREQFGGRYEDWLECLLPEDREGADAAMKEALQTGDFNHQFRIRRRDNGEVRWMNGRGLLSFDEGGKPLRMVGINVDITEHKRAEEALRQQASLLDLAHEPILAWNEEEGILFWNQGCQNLYGYSPGEAMGRTCHDLLKTVFPVPLEQFMAELADKGQWKGEVRQTTREGRELVIISRMQGIPMDQRFVILEANRDITDRKAMEEALLRMNENLERRIARRTAELRRANLALERSNHELQQFAYIAAHDLQTPLRSIAGFAQLLQKDYRGRLDEQADEWIDKLLEHTQRMQGLIQDVLTFSRVESRLNPRQPVNFNKLFDEVLKDMERPIRESGAAITRDELPVVHGDRPQLLQVLCNLVDNGIKYRREHPPRIHVSARRQHDSWLFSVRDNGIGIADRHRQRIFDIFRRLHTHQAYPGSGIGLSLCRRIVERHGGKIWVESDPGEGSVFYFTLPLENGVKP